MSFKETRKEKGVSTNNKLFKGCNCKRTKCQKNFCECYKNSKVCTEYCKCIDCLNFNADEKGTLLEVTKAESEPQQEQPTEETYVIENEVPISCYTIAPKKKRLNVLTRDIIESTIECVLSQAEECQRNNVTVNIAEIQILEEFGRCLEDIRRLTNMQNFLD